MMCSGLVVSKMHLPSGASGFGVVGLGFSSFSFEGKRGFSIIK
ncbi:hypothetical protein C900_01279 [Fulvivirga imtechensis AK7]|uniref:Uncharacterized protein n=1 Tax=Fulvivirga imtechensis AK7 TaxID=1237149 RepID=L8JIC6_9BACT|nr:hypothetical protein C900_01279 [Fulvivirga imtechensis AK7]